MDRPFVKKWLLYAGILCLTYLLQSTIFNRFTILGVYPMMVISAVACTSVFEGGDRGAALGLGAGMLLALSNVDNAPFYIFTLTVTGAVTGGLCRNYLTQTLLPTALLCALGALICEGAIWIVGVALGTIPASALITVVLPQLVCAMLFSLPLYFVNSRIHEAFREK